MSVVWEALQEDVRESTLRGLNPSRPDALGLLDIMRRDAFLACAGRLHDGAPLDHCGLAAQALETDAMHDSYTALAMGLLAP